MYEPQDYLNTIGEFHISKSDNVFSGVLIKNEEGFIVLSAALDKSWFEGNKFRECTIVGVVGGCKITLINAYNTCTKSYISSSTIEATFSPSEIILGNIYEEDILVRYIDANIPQLNKFMPFEISQDYLWEKDKSLSIDTTNLPILSGKDEDGALSIKASLNVYTDLECPHIKRYNTVSYEFIEPQGLTEAIRKIFSCRNMLAFYADYYLEMKDFTITDVSGNSCDLIMNYNNDVKKKTDLFVINWKCVSDSFEMVWERWCFFQKKASCIVNLFYEIISDNSTRVNLFLNLCQALEVYSNRFREEEARSVRRLYKDQFTDNSGKVLFEHRIFEILNYSGICKTDDIILEKNIASKIKEARNYFTHYAEDKDEPDYGFIIRYGYFLRATLLMIIYKEVGLINVEKEVMNYKYRYIIERVLEEAKI